MSALETFLEGCRSLKEIVSVTAEEPTPVMMAQIECAYTFEQKPTLFRFTIESAQGTNQNVNIIVPYEIWSKIPYAPVDQLLMAANRFHATGSECHCSLCDGNEEVFFLRPDIVDSYCLRGHKMTPMTELNESLNALVTELQKVPGVTKVLVHEIVDPALLESANCDGAVNITCELHGLTSARIDELNNLTSSRDDRYQIVLPKAAYEDQEHRASIVNTANKRINNPA
jgi:hypothetical protein